MPAAIYARYSSDLQRDQSIEDQFRLCREFAARQDIEVVAEYADAAKSGASLFGREGVVDLLLDAASGKFDTVVVESLDRLSRDQADLATLYKKLSFRGVKIVGVSGGTADEIQVGVRGLLGSLYLKDLADKTRRGLAGKVADGQSAGGRAYGYRPVKGEPGRLEIVEEEAEIVRRIFEEFADGANAREVAERLNKDGVPAPRRLLWAANTIGGHEKKGTGILRLALYNGEIVWNKLRYIKDPSTGRRVSRPNPPEEWRRTPAPELRIVEPVLWETVQARLAGRAKSPVGYVRKHRLLSGLIKCGVCGGGMAINGSSRGRNRIVCTRHRESGDAACSHGRSYYYEKVEEIVGAAFRSLLEDHEAMGIAVETNIENRRKLIAGEAKAYARAENELAKAKAKENRLVDFLIDGKITEATYDAKIGEARADVAEAEAALAATARSGCFPPETTGRGIGRRFSTPSAMTSASA